MKETLDTIRREALAALDGAGNAQELDALRVKYLGKKGELTAVLKMMGKLSAEERPAMGQLANEVRSALESALEAKGKELEAKALEDRLKAEALDITVPGKAVKAGHRHPMYIALDEIKEIFIGMGFTVLDGPEVELAKLNFDRLNAEEGHPSRDWSDTFYFDEDSRVMLRSQTSPMQVRAMDTMELPIRIIAPGRVYRKDEVDATHSPMFHQVEGMVIDKGVTMADLKGTLNTVVEQLYGKGTKTRFRPHHFPFTEPSCEMDVQCHKCGGVGCPTCKGEGWIPNVYSGWAFGIGLERTAMRRFKIADLRLIFENDVRFLEQF
ncbi:phenylalanine--tRNA ligase subunit alpha [Flavonifractor sp. An112]|uniref:phenylalanine--tRNA ligase subunit alpha n=1 Tax=Flavonifractor sp. An112 TaxID=1965544 RepID=UPI00174C7C5A|nr:phenylalanine--tRNA ligase subunit alpha [Flavonifractor sp. An112]